MRGATFRLCKVLVTVPGDDCSAQTQEHRTDVANNMLRGKLEGIVANLWSREEPMATSRYTPEAASWEQVLFRQVKACENEFKGQMEETDRFARNSDPLRTVL